MKKNTQKTEKHLEVTYIDKDKLVAHMQCVVHHTLGQVEIQSLFSTRAYENLGYEDILLEEIVEYSQKQGVASILVRIGPEPYNPEPHWTMDTCIAWYKEHGFVPVQGCGKYGDTLEYRVDM